ncbi:MAG: hypothetical protein U9O20_03975 [Patescibacteria group bacterium]|nr:hypothetical protein [Patescibacteria group bacterium]
MKEVYLKLKNKLWIEQWNVGVLKASKKDVVRGEVNFSKAKWLLNEKKNGFYADPFYLSVNNKHYIFFEEFEGENQKGKISYVELSSDSKITVASESKTAIEKTIHMSFPLFFDKNDQKFMIPETSDANEVAMYEMGDNVDEWKRKFVLLKDFPALDSIIFFHEGKYWLFCTNAEEGPNSHLYAFFCEDLEGEWKPHKKNPIKIDLESARPAGPVFRYDDELFRPAQNCQGTYGKEIVINKIKKLTPDEFSEEKVSVLSPFGSKKYTKGIHTISFFGEHLLIDGKRFAGIKKYFYPIVAMLKKVISKK